VLIDHLINPDVLAYARPGVEIRSVGKRSGRHSLPQAEINRLLIEAACDGRVVARLKGGDPFVFGRGGEEAEALVAAGIAWEVVPGISAGIAAAAYAGIPVLHRARASSVAFVSGHPGCDPGKVALEADTLVVFMCGSTIVRIARTLLARGRPRWMPVALICSGTTARHRCLAGHLSPLRRVASAARSPCRKVDLRIWHVLFTPAAVRFLFCEPMLGAVPRPLPSWMGTGLTPSGTFHSPKFCIGRSSAARVATVHGRCTSAGRAPLLSSAKRPERSCS